MAVVSVGEVLNRTGSVNEKGERSYQRTFTVVTDDPQDGPLTAITAVGIGVGTSYATANESDAATYATAINATCSEEGGLVWSVTVDYGKFEESPDSPFDQPTSYSFGSNRVEKLLDRDANNKPIVNTVNDAFLETLSKEVARPTLSMTKNLAYPALSLFDYINTTNSDGFFGCRPNTLRVTDVTSQSNFDQSFGTYYTVSVSMEYNPETWKTYVLNAGMRELDDDGKKQDILIKGVPTSDPVPLSKQGKAIPGGQQPVYLDFQIYNQAPFSFLFFAFL